MGRKQFLKGGAFELPEPSFSTDNYHLFSRYYELKLLHLHQTGQALDAYIQETTQEILQRHTEHEDLFRDLFNVGRWCRALIYTRSISQLKDHVAWIKLCKRCFHLDYDNIEFKAPIFTFLKLSGDHWLNFDFYKKNRFDNAVIESQLLLSIGLKNKRAIDHFGKALKLNVSF